VVVLNQPTSEDRSSAGDATNQPLLDLPDALVSDRGRVSAAYVLGVNYRTLMTCYDSRRMRQALAEFMDGKAVVDDEPGDVDSDDVRASSTSPWSSGWRRRRMIIAGCRSWWTANRANWRS
jgi:hypothetical protein